MVVDKMHNYMVSSVRVEPTNAACAPSTASSDALNLYTTEASTKKGCSSSAYNAY